VCEEVITTTSLDFINKGQQTHVGPAMDKDFNFSSCIHCGQCVQVCPTGALHEKHNITEVQEYLNKPEFLNIIQYSPVVAAGLAEELGIKATKEFDTVLNAILRKIGFAKVFSTGFGTDVLITELSLKLTERIEKGEEGPLYISACPAWVKYCEQYTPEILPELSTLKSSQQITGVLIKTLVADKEGVKPQQIFSVSVTPCTAGKFEARRDGMMRKGISDVDTVLTVRELARLIRLNGIDVQSTGSEPFDEPMDMRSSAAAMAEVSGGLTEAVIRSAFYEGNKREADKQLFKKIRGSGNFRDAVIPIGDKEVRIAIVDGLTGLEKLKASLAAGTKYHLIEVMVCPGGCVRGGGLPLTGSKDVIKNRAKMVFQNEENEAVSLPCKSPSLLNLYEKFAPASKDISDKSIYLTRYSKRDVLL
jgi:iron-only hydrogenase group A